MPTRIFRLTEEQVTELRTAYSLCTNAQAKTRYQAVRLYGSGYSVGQILDICVCSNTSLMYWCRIYRKGGINALDDHRLGGNRPLSEVKYPNLEATLEQMLADETAGDPMTEQKWIRSSLQSLCSRLMEQNISVSPGAVRRLLEKMGFALRVSVKTRKGYADNREKQEEQFDYIASQKRTFKEADLPIISVDTKKKELIGDFKREGKTWCKEAEKVNDYDFPSYATGRAIPYGIYDVTQNKGFIYVGTSADTSEFAVDAIAWWWEVEGIKIHSHADKLLILADGGGSNGYRSRAWKQQIQIKLCDRNGLTVTVCHYPNRCSKWNPIERRLFSQISVNWAGKPLRSLETMLGYIRGTTTKTGLTVKAFLQEKEYQKGQRVTKQEMDMLSLEPHEISPERNYTLKPRREA